MGQEPPPFPPNDFTLEKVEKSAPEREVLNEDQILLITGWYRNPHLLTFGGAEPMGSHLHHILLYRAANPGGEPRPEPKAGIARGERGEFWYLENFN